MIYRNFRCNQRLLSDPPARALRTISNGALRMKISFRLYLYSCHRRRIKSTYFVGQFGDCREARRDRSVPAARQNVAQLCGSSERKMARTHGEDLRTWRTVIFA
jgi:hypothetical protein